MVDERQYPHNHGDLVTVGGKEVIFGDGFEYVREDVLVASEDGEAAISRLEAIRSDGSVSTASPPGR